jgi:hypothetical protein
MTMKMMTSKGVSSKRGRNPTFIPMRETYFSLQMIGSKKKTRYCGSLNWRVESHQKLGRSTFPGLQIAQ